jgi:hypothetical protein
MPMIKSVGVKISAELFHNVASAFLTVSGNRTGGAVAAR